MTTKSKTGDVLCPHCGEDSLVLEVSTIETWRIPEIVEREAIGMGTYRELRWHDHRGSCDGGDEIGISCYGCGKEVTRGQLKEAGFDFEFEDFR